MSSICLVAGLLSVALGSPVTMRWTHSIEKIIWEEDYQIQEPRAGQPAPALLLTQARIRGNGAGMEVPAGAVLRDGVWSFRPALAALPQVHLTHSAFVAPYWFCTQQTCRSLPELLPELALDSVVELKPCP